MKKILLLSPFLLLLAGITYSSFSTPLSVGNAGEPDIVTTTNLEWNLYQPSELGFPWSAIPDVADIRFDDPMWESCLTSCLSSSTCYCEEPDVASITAEKLNSKIIHVEISNAYPGYAGISHFIFFNEGGMPSKLREVKMDINDPNGMDEELRTIVLLVWYDGESYIKAVPLIGFRLSELPDLIESLLANETFLPGGWVGFCKLENATVQVVGEIVSDNPGISEDQIDRVLDADSFWIYVPPDSSPPQGANMEFNLTFVFGQFNE